MEQHSIVGSVQVPQGAYKKGGSHKMSASLA